MLSVSVHIRYQRFHDEHLPVSAQDLCLLSVTAVVDFALLLSPNVRGTRAVIIQKTILVDWGSHTPTDQVILLKTAQGHVARELWYEVK